MNFDYIVIGAGSAGCLLANRLSADPNNKVLLLEAGGADKDKNIHIPGAFPKLFKTKMDWNYHTVPQKNMMNRQMYQPRGKVLGGCSSTNAMIYIRGHRYDYDSWAEMGNEGWSYEEILPYFKQYEQNLNFKDKFHGNDGELTVTNHIERHDLTHTFVKAGQQAGHTLTPDFNGQQQEGVGYFQVTQHEGKRCSAAVAFLNPIKNRSNLTIMTNALVHKVVIENGQATGVFFEQDGRTQTAITNREIILSAGAFNSPQLLMLSGIGDEKELKEHGIEVKKHLSGVGKNLQDHLLGGIATTTKKDTLDSAERFPVVLKNLWNYFVHKKGPFTTNVAEAGGFFKTDAAMPAPNLQLHFAPVYFIGHGFNNPPKGNGYSLGITMVAMHGRGTVSLASANPKDSPLIDPRYFSDERDQQEMVAGFKIAEKILAQPAFDTYRDAMYLPDRKLTDESKIIAILSEMSETIYHPTSTCKMGTDDMAVVDSKLQVHGIQGLRVADASVMPNVVRGNTNAPVMMIAEKAAAMILAKSKVSTKKMSV